MKSASALRSRRTWLLLASLVLAALAGAAGWRLWHFWQTAWSLPLHLPLSDIHFPAQVFNEDGRLQRAYNKAAVGLSLVALLSVVITVFVRSWADDGARELVGLVGGVCTGMILLVAWAMQADAQVNGGLRKLADNGNFAELERATRSKTALPYARYIGAQALVLAGKADQLRREYGPWLQDWGREAASRGYLRPGMTGREIPDWGGISASPRVMRALELLAFGRGTSVFSSDYEARVRRDTLTAERQGLLVGVLFALCAALSLMTAWRVRVFGQRIDELERRRAMLAAESTMPARM